MGLFALLKPEYLLRPRQLLRRVWRSVFRSPPGRTIVTLPWGWPMEVDPTEDIGRALVHLGVYDLVVSEALWRLCDEGETALDLGANIGYMTALLARRVGQGGRVLSFEAHPDNARELRANAARWAPLAGDGVIAVHEVALSDAEGTVRFEMPADFEQNRGTGRVAAGPVEAAGSAALVVPSTTLDLQLASVPRVGVAKLDVEGHEEAVLHGARQTLERRTVRDWVFEHHEPYPSPVTQEFERHGYQVYQLARRFFRPVVAEASAALARSAWMAQSFLATADAPRVLERIKRGGWKVLG